MKCPICDNKLTEIFDDNVHEWDLPLTQNYVCDKCGFDYLENVNERQELEDYIEEYEDAALSGCNDKDLQEKYSKVAKWLKELLTIKEGNK